MTNSYKWVILTAYLLVTGLSQLLWLNFAPLISLVETKYGVGESTASLLILVFPLIYVFLSVPSGILIDTRGYRRVVGTAALLMTVSSAIRIYDDSFWALLAGQVGIAIAQPFI